MITFPPCKINLGLWVTRKLDNGYHTIATLMYPVPWCDVLEIIPSKEKTHIAVTGLPVEGAPESNLCFKAWQLVEKKYSIPPVAIHLHKIIPTGAGLGGGSSDAAHMLLLLNAIFSLHLPPQELQELAVNLGMDCPFFLTKSPMLATGRGEMLSPVNLNLDGMHLLIVKPAVCISTREAYAGVKPLERASSLESVVSQDITTWQKNLVNDFETSIFIRHPEILDIKLKLLKMGAIYSAMSGSGAAIFGLFHGKPPQVDFPDCSNFETLLGSNF